MTLICSIRLEAIASSLEAIAIRLEAIATRLASLVRFINSSFFCALVTHSQVVGELHRGVDGQLSLRLGLQGNEQQTPTHTTASPVTGIYINAFSFALLCRLCNFLSLHFFSLSLSSSFLFCSSFSERPWQGDSARWRAKKLREPWRVLAAQDRPAPLVPSPKRRRSVSKRRDKTLVSNSFLLLVVRHLLLLAWHLLLLVRHLLLLAILNRFVLVTFVFCHCQLSFNRCEERVIFAHIVKVSTC